MAFVPERNLIVLEIPKSGSRTLFDAARNITGRKHLPAQGHHDIATSIRRANADNPHVIAVIRSPESRLVSSINFHFARKQDRAELDNAMRLAATNGPGFTAVFNTQSHYLNSDNLPHTLSLYPLERINDALAEIGHKPIHKNANPHGWPADEIKAHPCWPELLSWYEADKKLHEELI